MKRYHLLSHLFRDINKVLQFTGRRTTEVILVVIGLLVLSYVNFRSKNEFHRFEMLLQHCSDRGSVQVH